MNIPILDLTAPTHEQMTKAAEFIGLEIQQSKVYVHCKIGYSRSAAMVGAYLVAAGTVQSAEEAISLMRDARPSLIVRSEIKKALKDFGA